MDEMANWVDFAVYMFERPSCSVCYVWMENAHACSPPVCKHDNSLDSGVIRVIYDVLLEYIPLIHWPIVNIGSVNSLVPSGNKSFPETIFTWDLCCHMELPATRYSVRNLNQYVQLMMKQHQSGWCLGTETISQFVDIWHLIFLFS